MAVYAVAVRAYHVLKPHAVKDVEECGRNEVGIECGKHFQCEKDRGGLSYREVARRGLSQVSIEVVKDSSEVVTDAVEDESGKIG